MTEADYLSKRRQPLWLYDFAAARTPPLKHRLIASAVCRVSPHMRKSSGPVLSLVEDHARGLLPDDALTTAVALLKSAPHRHHPHLDVLMNPNVGGGARLMFGSLLAPRSLFHSYPLKTSHYGTVCDLIRDIAGNPFRRWQSLPPWMGHGVIQPTGEEVRFTSNVRPLAEVIDRHRHYDRLPVLADAFEESGVTDAELLEHCRNTGTHYPGCWAVDLALGRAIRAK